MALALVQQITIGINQEWLAEWIAYRREDCKKPMSDRAVRMVTKKLLQWSEVEQERLICHAIECEWRGIYWVEPMKQQSTRNSDIYAELTDTSWAT
jgi:hypothetical protein